MSKLAVEVIDRPVCVIDVIGDEGVGKSTLVREWKKSSVFKELQRVMEVYTREYRTAEWSASVPSKPSKFYFHGFFLVYDNTTAETLQNILVFTKSFLGQLSKGQRLKQPPVMFLIANKDDLEEQEFMLDDTGNLEAHMKAGGICRWECTCATQGRNTEFPFVRLIFQMLGIGWIRKMGKEACYLGCLNLVKILIHHLDEEELSSGGYAVEAFRGVSDKQQQKLNLEEGGGIPRLNSLPNVKQRKMGTVNSPLRSVDPLLASPLVKRSGSMSTLSQQDTLPEQTVSDSMDVLTYLFSLNKLSMMRRIATEGSYNADLLGKILRQYYPMRSNGELKWRRLNLHILHGPWLAHFVGVTEVNLAHNKLKSLPVELFQMKTVKTILVYDNLLSSLPDAKEWQCDSLSSLDLSQNLLKGSEGGSLLNKLPGASSAAASYFTRKLSPAIQAKRRSSGGLAVQRLFRVNISANPITTIPPWILELPGLAVLDIRCPNLQRLPKELANCRSLLTLKIDQDRVCYPNKKILDGGVRAIREHLYREVHKSVSYFHMNLFVLGNVGTGKSRLLACLQDISNLKLRHAPSTSSQKAGLRTCHFSLKPKGASHEITFHAVDFAGQEVFHSTHQCFMSHRAVYLAVWNAHQGKTGLLALKPWLLSIQARAPKAPVILVATHCDDHSTENITALEDVVQSVYPYHDGQALLNAKGLPAIVDSVYMSLHSSSPSNTGLSELRKRIFNTALTVRSPQATSRDDTYLKHQVPRSYIILQDAVAEKLKEKRHKQLPAVMEINAFWDMAKKANCQIDDISGLLEATRFLHEAGLLLHFADAQGQLPDYIFIDPQWLYDTIACIIDLDSSADDESLLKKRRKGVLRSRWMPRILRWRAPAECHTLLLNVLENFHIIVALNSEHSTFLVPALLPESAPSVGTMGFTAASSSESFSSSAAEQIPMRYPLSEALVRQYQLPYVPSSFWSKLISSLIVLFTERKGTMMPSAAVDLEPEVLRNSAPTPLPGDFVDGSANPASAASAASATAGRGSLGRKGAEVEALALRSRLLTRVSEAKEDGDEDEDGDDSNSSAECHIATEDAVPDTASSGVEIHIEPSATGGGDSSGNQPRRKLVDCQDSSVFMSIDDTADLEASDEPDGSLLKFKLKSMFTPVAPKRRSSSDILGTLLDVDDDFMLLDLPPSDNSGVGQCGCCNDEGNDATSDTMSMLGSMLGSIVSHSMAPAAPGQRRNDMFASPYLLTLLKCIKDESRYDEYISASQVHLVIRAWQTGIAVHISLPDFSSRNPSVVAAAAARRSSRGKTFVEVRLEQLPGHENSGLQMAVWGHQKLQCCMLAQATYLTDSILEDWFPGLFRNVYRCVPCPRCVAERVDLTESYRFLPSQTHMFDLDRLMSAAFSASKSPHCPLHGAIEMKALAPDVLLCDLPCDLLLDADDFDDNLRLSDEDKLGDGGFAQVYRSTYQGRQVAVKVFTPKQDSRTLPYQELRTEVSALDQLKQEHVVKLIGVCISPLCLVLELAPMGSMSSVLRTTHNYGVPLNIAHKALFQVANALDYLHNLRIIYRDLKPQNILVWSLTPGRVLVKLADYGIATFALPAGIKDPQGTKGYMAPEVSAKSRVPYTEKADIFSLGLVIFEVVTGRKPYWEKAANFNMQAAQLAGYTPSLADAIKANMLDEQKATMSSLLAASPESQLVEGYYDRPPMADMLVPMVMPAFDEVDSSITDDSVTEKRSSIFEFSESADMTNSSFSPQPQEQAVKMMRCPSLDSTMKRPMSTPFHRRTSALTLSTQGQRNIPPPSSFRRTHWFNVHGRAKSLDESGSVASTAVSSEGVEKKQKRKNPVTDCLLHCFQTLVDSSLYPTPDKRPSAQTVASHMSVCCCYPRHTQIRISPGPEHKIILCATAIHVPLVQPSSPQHSPSGYHTGLPDITLSPISADHRDTDLAPFGEEDEKEQSDSDGQGYPIYSPSDDLSQASLEESGGDMVDGRIPSHRRRPKASPSMLRHDRRLTPAAVHRVKHPSNASVTSMGSVRRQALLRRQDTFNESIILPNTGSLSRHGSLNQSDAVKSPTLPSTFSQYACVCCDDEVKSIDCSNGETQACICAFDGDEITAGCCTACEEIWVGTAGGIVQVHSLPSLKMIGRNAVPAAVTCMLPLRPNSGVSMLPMSEVLVGSQDGNLARFFSTPAYGHAISGPPKFVIRASRDDDGAIRCISHANSHNEFCVVVGDNLLLVFDCVQWEEKMRAMLYFCDKRIQQIVMSERGLWLFAEQSPDLVLVDLSDGSALKHICTRCRLLQSVDLPMTVPNSKPSSKLYTNHYFRVVSIAVTDSHLWALMSSGVLLVFDISRETASNVPCTDSLVTMRQAHHGPGCLQTLDGRSVCSIGLPPLSSSWLPRILQDSDDHPQPMDGAKPTLLQWEVQ